MAAFNEEQTIGPLIKTIIQEQRLPVIVVDDASTDQTRQAAWEAGATILPLPINLGHWIALQTGLKYALDRGYQTVVSMDADGQHPPQEIPTILAPILNQQSDVCIGSFPARGTWLRKASWKFFQTISGLPVKDLTSGFKAFNQRAVQILIHHRTLLYDYQDLGALILLFRQGMRIKEVPVHMQPRQHGHSRVFGSWGAVCKYMLTSTVLCLSKRSYKG